MQRKPDQYQSFSLLTRLKIYLGNRSFRNFPRYLIALYFLVQFTVGLAVGFSLALDKVTDWFRRRFQLPSASPRGSPEEEWAFVNHSEPSIEWKEVTDDQLLKSVRSTLAKRSGNHWPDLYGIDRLQETNATHNFRVVPVCAKPFMLRLHVGEAALDRIKADQKVRQWLVSRNIFERSVGPSLLPLVASGGSRHVPVDFEVKPEVEQRGERPIFARYAECFPYAHGVAHFSPRSEEQMLSFARLLGKLQAELQSMDRSLHPPLSEEDREAYWCEPAELKAGLEKVSRWTADIRRENLRTIVETWRANEDLIFDRLEKCCSFWSTGAYDEKLPLLHDVHPHNAFFVGEDCVLIYDYQWIADWRHGDVIAYTLHRFVREWVRESREKGDPHAIDQIPGLVSQFLAAYSEHGPRFPSNVESTLHLRIAGACLFKLRHVMLCRVLKEDPFHRPGPLLDQEVQKFISFLKEAPYFVL